MAKIAKFSMRRSLAGILNGCLLAALCIVVACGLSDTDNPKSLTGRGAGDKVPEAPVAGTTACPDTLFRSGDLVFRRGRSVSSDMVLLCEDKPTYSHVGLLVRTDSGWLVVHAAPDEADERGRYNRVTAEPPDDFWQARRCRAAGVFRLPLSAAEAERLTAEALRQAGEGRPFDHRFDERDTTAFYCTEFINFLFGKIGLDPSQGRRTRDGLIPFAPPLVLPGHLLAHPDLQPVWRFP